DAGVSLNHLLLLCDLVGVPMASARVAIDRLWEAANGDNTATLIRADTRRLLLATFSPLDAMMNAMLNPDGTPRSEAGRRLGMLPQMRLESDNTVTFRRHHIALAHLLGELRLLLQALQRPEQRLLLSRA
ncbi:MAG: hypothetical protein AAFX99_37250, partial [Myxococcota bacterium]